MPYLNLPLVSDIIVRMINKHITLNCNGRLLSLEQPIVMGIINATPDSFYEGSRVSGVEGALQMAELLLNAGAAILDIGGMSSRPGAQLITVEEELVRVVPVLKAIKHNFPNAIISVDTVHAEVARVSVLEGAGMINDISAGKMDANLYATVAKLGVPYVLMHMQGKPANMQIAPTYDNILEEVIDFLTLEVGKLRRLGIKDIIIDPGFGFGKTMEDNYRLLQSLHVFQILGLPIMAGLSRKSMIYKLLDIEATEALNGTSALHMVALQQGSKILRTHDVKAANEVIKLWSQLESH